MEQSQKLLKDYTDTEKGAYLSAIASIATADRSASAEELQFLDTLAESAELTPDQKNNVRRAATEVAGDELKMHLDVLKNSELRYSLLTDLIAFAESDQHYSEEEKAGIEQMAQYLNVNQEQFSTINQFVQKTSTADLGQEQVKQQGFLGSLGLDEKFKRAGLDMGSLTKGLLGMSGPMILADLVRKGFSGNKGNTGGGTVGGTTGKGGGGFGSMISMISGGRGIKNAGGLLGKLFK
jgi:uncharacterized tellurite resistance protein B-like protein